MAKTPKTPTKALRPTKHKVKPASRFPVQTKSWSSNFPSIINQTAATAQATSFRSNKPKRTTDILSDTQSKSHHDPFVGLMWPRGGALNHPAANDLITYATKGCPVDCGRDWTIEEITAAVTKGPSKHMMDHPDAVEQCRAEALQKVKEGHCLLISWNSIKDNPPSSLKVSPITIVQHKSRKWRMILNLAYQLRMYKERLQSVNQSSTKELAPHHSLFELGNCIPRLIWAMATAPDTGVPLLFSKIDLKDGYWRMVVDAIEAWNFAYVLPSLNPDDDIQLVIPNALQMGWSKSPTFFCAATETARDLADKYIANNRKFEPQPSEDICMNIDWDKIRAAI